MCNNKEGFCKQKQTVPKKFVYMQNSTYIQALKGKDMITFFPKKTIFIQLLKNSLKAMGTSTSKHCLRKGRNIKIRIQFQKLT